MKNYYNGTISEAYIDPTRNPNRVIFRVAFTDAGFEGVIRSTGLMKPGSTQKDNRGYLTRLFCQDELKRKKYNNHIKQINFTLTSKKKL